MKSMGRWCLYVLMPDLFGAHWALCTSPLQKATEKNVLDYIFISSEFQLKQIILMTLSFFLVMLAWQALFIPSFEEETITEPHLSQST